MEEKNIMVSLGDSRIKEISEVIGNKTCNKILDLLSDKESTVGEISTRLNIPINTADYNVKKLVKAGLIESSKSWWSVKGKKMPSYKLSNKRIIISPKKTPTKSFALALLLTLVFALVVRNFTYNDYDIGSQDSFEQAASTFSLEASSKMAPTVMMGSQISFIDSINSWQWFLVGAWLAIIIYLLIDFNERRRK